MTTGVFPVLTTWLRRVMTAPPEAAPAARVIALAPGHVRTVYPTPAASRLIVSSGVVWVTTTPAEGDVVLRAGEEVRVGGRWPVVVQAVEAARVAVR